MFAVCTCVRRHRDLLLRLVGPVVYRSIHENKNTEAPKSSNSNASAQFGGFVISTTQPVVQQVSGEYERECASGTTSCLLLCWSLCCVPKILSHGLFFSMQWSLPPLLCPATSTWTPRYNVCVHVCVFAVCFVRERREWAFHDMCFRLSWESPYRETCPTKTKNRLSLYSKPSTFTGLQSLGAQVKANNENQDWNTNLKCASNPNQRLCA